jgi:hypothetical protein
MKIDSPSESEILWKYSAKHISPSAARIFQLYFLSVMYQKFIY